jgi:polyisoprenoid-binding protein YceI
MMVVDSTVSTKEQPMSATQISERIPAGTYNLDPSHASVGFAVRHLGMSSVRGAFQRFQGSLEASGETPVLQGTVDVASISTADEQRDAHLTAPDFFDVERHPEIRFHSTAIDLGDDGTVKLAGEITIKGVTKPIELTGTIGGGADPWGNERVGIDLEGTIDRREFGLKWNQTLPNGDLLVGNEVKLLVNAEAVKAA